MSPLTATFNDFEIQIPEGISDNASFLRWALSDQAPEKGKYSYLGDHLWIDMSMETLFHNTIKSAIAFVLGSWVAENNLGEYCTDGMLMSRPDVELSCEPDGMFISEQAYDEGRVKLQQGDKSKVILGSPDMVLEVVSKSSTLQDTKTKKKLYHRTGIQEYWLVDSRLESPSLIIYQHTPKAYIHVKPKSGWLWSTVFQASFRLQVEGKQDGRRKVKLERR